MRPISDSPRPMRLRQMTTTHGTTKRKGRSQSSLLYSGYQPGCDQLSLAYTVRRLRIAPTPSIAIATNASVVGSGI